MPQIKGDFFEKIDNGMSFKKSSGLNGLQIVRPMAAEPFHETESFLTLNINNQGKLSTFRADILKIL
jgi:hypothetical protein